MTFYALDFHFSIPSTANDLSPTVGIVLVCFVELHHQCSFGVARMDAYCWQICVPKRMPMPDAQWAGLECDPNGVWSTLPDHFFDFITA